MINLLSPCYGFTQLPDALDRSARGLPPRAESSAARRGAAGGSIDFASCEQRGCTLENVLVRRSLPRADVVARRAYNRADRMKSPTDKRARVCAATVRARPRRSSACLSARRRARTAASCIAPFRGACIIRGALFPAVVSGHVGALVKKRQR